jgi:hypothetical protein
LAESVECRQLPAQQDLAVGVGLGQVSGAQASVIYGDAVFCLASQRRVRVGDSELDDPLRQAPRGELDGIAD